MSTCLNTGHEDVSLQTFLTVTLDEVKWSASHAGRFTQGNVLSTTDVSKIISREEYAAKTRKETQV
jgi:hypothetical protein